MKKYHKHILIFFLFIGAITPLLTAQEGRGQARLKGVVVDKEGNPIEGAIVELESLVHQLSLSTKTDADGNWSFLGLGKTVVKLKASKEGYDPTIIPELNVSSFTRQNAEQKIILTKTTDMENLETEGPKTLYLKGENLYNNEEYEKAILALEEMVSKYPELYEARITIGNSYIKLNQYDKAIQEFTYVLEKMKEEHLDLTGNATASSLYASLGEIYMDKNDFEKSREYFKKSIELDPSNHTVAYNVAEILFNANEIDDAMHNYKLASEIKPDWPKPYLKLGYCYLNKGDTQTAIDNFNKFIELSPEDDPQVTSIKNIIRTLDK